MKFEDDKDKEEREESKMLRLVVICFFASHSVAIWLRINGNPRIENERRNARLDVIKVGEKKKSRDVEKVAFERNR